MNILKTLFGIGLVMSLGALSGQAQAGQAAPVTVRSAQEFRQAVAQARPGARILLAPGTYPGGFYFDNVRGTQAQPIVIAAADPQNPPVFKGGNNGLHFTASSYLELRNLSVQGMSDNGINIDDGGVYDRPARHIRVVGLRISDIGPQGNHDGLKLSGIDDFRVEGCTIERWGTGGGSAIDMVGCHDGVITGCRFRHSDETGSTGVQAKGGCRHIAVRRNRFESAGGRAVNIGGSTGLEFFRPPLKTLAGQPLSEAKDILVEDNIFIGGGTPVAFVGVDGATVRFNTIYRPKRWALRILQETVAPGFVPSRNGVFTDNIIAFRADEWAEAVNIGPNTAPQTFRFARNVWYCLDAPARSRPNLPTPEANGVYGKDPLFRNAERGDFRLRPGSPASNAGARAADRRETGREDAIMAFVQPQQQAAGERITLFAGGGEGADNIPATQAKLIEPFGVDFDKAGNTYIVEMTVHRVRRVDGRGLLTTIAGDGTEGYSGDGGPARQARLNSPHSLAVAPNGDLYIADTLNSRVRRIDHRTGIITTAAGTGQNGFGGDGGPATQAQFNGIYCLAFDRKAEHLYLADLENRRVRVIDMKTGIVTTVAGNGQRGVPQDGADARTSPLVDPRAVAVDGQGRVYILERSGNALRVVEPDGKIRTVVGTGAEGATGDGGDARQATLNGPKHLCVDKEGNVLIADTENHLIRKYLPKEGRIVRVAGTGRAGTAGIGGDPLQAELHQPHGVAFHPSGALYISDSTNNRVLKIAR
ncbi:MAG TPA: right-handed parallel beta-helix repeat-containing protein [Chthonomonadaceae bacterium]|nr:right-handed parallel beta-helix repeat-containing protein [Chthonomonadaceae bacterium]